MPKNSWRLGTDAVEEEEETKQWHDLAVMTIATINLVKIWFGIKKTSSELYEIYYVHGSIIKNDSIL